MTHPRPIKVRDNSCRDPRLAGITIHLYLYILNEPLRGTSLFYFILFIYLCIGICGQRLARYHQFAMHHQLQPMLFSDKSFCSKIFSLINRVVELASAKQR